MNRRGFTVVELIIVITIMAILLILAVVNLRSSQVSARDDERRADTESIATTLETFYDTTYNGRRGFYPGTTNLTGTSDTYVANFFSDHTTPAALHAPDVDINGPISIVAATNATQTTTGVTPQPTISTYVYQPLTADNRLCTNSNAAIPLDADCKKYNIFFKLENPSPDCPAPSNICMLRGKYQ